MALKFQCKNCGKDIAVRFLTVGEAAECKSCGASNSVPESAESISDEAAKSITKASVFRPVERISNNAISHDLAESVPIAKTLRIVGRILIGLGIIAGIVGAIRVLIQHPAPDQTMALAISIGVTWLMITFFSAFLVCFV